MGIPRTYGGWIWLALLLIAPAAAAAQVGTPASIASDSFLALVPPRDLAEIRRDIVSAEQARMVAAEAEQLADRLRTGAEVRIEAKKRAIAATKDRKNISKRERRDAEVAALEAERKALEREKDLLERRKSLRNAEIDLSKRRIDLATLDRQALELEHQLMLKRAERATVASGTADAVRLDQVTFDLERAALEAMKQRAEREREVADREKQVIDRRLKILEARRNLVRGG